ncbi:MAG: glycoside hydrolase family 2, partial [Lachnospiraceae bacterium]|nr:glycoside hydrolase family 2 [Lachnospiraceae bacterium]
MKHVKCHIPEYPRPQFVRNDWENLNGQWSFAFGGEVTGEDALAGRLLRSINVPFTYETELSGINDPAQHHVVWYSRKIKGREGKRTILIFEGVDHVAEVYVNGRLVGTHKGAYTRFSFDVTDYLAGNEGILTVKCVDEDLPVQIRGKQRWEKESYACWYVQTTGIWKTVWLEYVDEVRLTRMKITPDIYDSSATFDIAVSRPSQDTEVRIAVSFDGKPVQTVSVIAADIDNTVRIRLDSGNITYQTMQWEIWNPVLYDVEITVLHRGETVDKVGSYFGLREYSVRDGKVLLNGKPFYSKLILDQGYWPQSGITPPSEEAVAEDIRLAKEMGFNGARKHQKNEDERFYYYADICGFAVWCELPSNHWFSDDAVKDITSEWLDIVTQNYSHPSLVTWVLFNESWGVKGISHNSRQQAAAEGLYYLTRSIDPMRPVISNDGWVHVKSDILTLHHYEQDGAELLRLYDNRKKLTDGYAGNPQFLPFAEDRKYEGQPVILTEFGGTHYSREEGWGYGVSVDSDDEFL